MAGLGSLRAFLGLWVLIALPVEGFAQQLDMVPGQTRLQRDLGLAINSTVCPALAADPGVNRDDGSLAGDLFGRCNDLIATATEINSGIPGGNSLGLSAGELNAALDSIAHTQMPAIGRGASEISVIQAGIIGERLYALREGADGVQIAGHAYDEEGRRVDFDVDLLEASGAAGDDALAGSGFGAFLNVKGGFGDRDTTGEELGFDYYNTGATLGMDYRFSENFFAGIAGGYTYSDRDFSRSGGNIESDTASGWLFLGFQEQGFYLDGLYGFSYHWIDTERDIVIPIGAAPSGLAMAANRTAKGDTEATEHQLAANAGYVFEFGGLGLGPIAGIEWITLDVDDFDESGAGGLALSYEDDDLDSLITTLGAEASYDLSTDFGVLTPQVRAAWAHQFDDDSRDITAQYRFDPTNTRFFVRTRSPDRDYVDLGLSVAAQLPGGLSMFLAYDTILGHSYFSVHSFTLGGRLEF
jgi:outer membrane autotransporter protein